MDVTGSTLSEIMELPPEELNVTRQAIRARNKRQQPSKGGQRGPSP